MEDSSIVANIYQDSAQVLSCRILTLLNHDVLTLMTLLGCSRGLLELMEAIPETTTAELAKVAKLHEGYDSWLFSNMHVCVIFVFDEPF